MFHYRKLEELLDDPINEKLFELYLKVKDSPRHIAIKAENLLNEVYYISAKISKDKNPVEHLVLYTKEIESDLGWYYGVDLVFPMLYAVLNVRKRIPQKLQALMNTLENQYGNTCYWKIFAQPLAVTTGKKKSNIITIDTTQLMNAMKNGKGIQIIQVQNANIEVKSPGNYIARNIINE